MKLEILKNEEKQMNMILFLFLISIRWLHFSMCCCSMGVVFEMRSFC